MMSSFAKPNILSPLFLLFLHVLLAALKQAAFLSFLVFFFPATPLFPPFDQCTPIYIIIVGGIVINGRRR